VCPIKREAVGLQTREPRVQLNSWTQSDSPIAPVRDSFSCMDYLLFIPTTHGLLRADFHCVYFYLSPLSSTILIFLVIWTHSYALSLIFKP
jgi:hypothetical protein